MKTRIEEMKARIEAATDMPWCHYWGGGIFHSTEADDPIAVVDAFKDEPHNRLFLVHATKDMPWLVGIVERMLPSVRFGATMECYGCGTAEIPECRSCEERALLAELEN